jgi:hypothetical protein
VGPSFVSSYGNELIRPRTCSNDEDDRKPPPIGILPGNNEPNPALENCVEVNHPPRFVKGREVRPLPPLAVVLDYNARSDFSLPGVTGLFRAICSEFAGRTLSSDKLKELYGKLKKEAQLPMETLFVVKPLAKSKLDESDEIFEANVVYYDGENYHLRFKEEDKKVTDYVKGLRKKPKIDLGAFISDQCSQLDAFVSKYDTSDAHLSHSVNNLRAILICLEATHFHVIIDDESMIRSLRTLVNNYWKKNFENRKANMRERVGFVKNCVTGHRDHNLEPEGSLGIQEIDILEHVSSLSTKKIYTYVELRETDVLCGRGGGINRHKGNMLFNDKVNCFRGMYSKNLEIKEKSDIAYKLIKTMIENYGSRFLKFCNKQEKWYILSNKEILDKAKQALREQRQAARRDFK